MRYTPHVVVAYDPWDYEVTSIYGPYPTEGAAEKELSRLQNGWSEYRQFEVEPLRDTANSHCKVSEFLAERCPDLLAVASTFPSQEATRRLLNLGCQHEEGKKAIRAVIAAMKLWKVMGRTPYYAFWNDLLHDTGVGGTA